MSSDNPDSLDPNLWVHFCTHHYPLKIIISSDSNKRHWIYGLTLHDSVDIYTFDFIINRIFMSSSDGSTEIPVTLEFMLTQNIQSLFSQLKILICFV
jgi:hypothetical protein